MSGQLYAIPAGQEPNICRGKGCGAKIFWVQPEGRRPMPVNADGTSHFATCPDAADFRKKAAASPVRSGSAPAPDEELEDLRAYYRADQRLLAIVAAYDGKVMPEVSEMEAVDMIQIKKTVAARRSVR